jgi:hypothetical protein
MNKKTIFGITAGMAFIVIFFPQIANASIQNEELCKDNGGTINNSGKAYELENLDYCLDLNPETCSEINGVWEDCIPPDCSDLSKPCPTVLCIEYDVCKLSEKENSFEETHSMPNQKNRIFIVSNSTDEDCYLGCTNPSELFIESSEIIEFINTLETSYSISTGNYYEGEKGREFSVDNRFTGKIGPNEKFSFQFFEPGEYQYFINEHRILQVLGTIHVLGDSYTRNDTSLNVLHEVMKDENSLIPITSLKVNPNNSAMTIGVDDQKNPQFTLNDYKQMIYQEIGTKYFEIISNTISEESSSDNWQEFSVIGSFGSGNLTVERLFKIHASMDNATITQLDSHQGHYFIIHFSELNSDSIFQIQIPRFLPFSNSSNEWHLGLIVFVNGEESKFEKNLTECYVELSVPVIRNAESIEISGTMLVSGHPYQGEVVSKKCIDKTVDRSDFNERFPSPRQQQKENLPLIFCGEALQLIYKINDAASCVQPESIPKLIERGWAKNE